jgi:hypothetical protein
MRNAQQGLARKLSMYRALDLGVGLEVCVISVKPNTLKLLLTNSGGRFICASAWSIITRYSPRRTILDYSYQFCL